jgi:pimeloyl-ACP methyl ester carboxylesterase
LTGLPNPDILPETIERRAFCFYRKSAVLLFCKNILLFVEAEILLSKFVYTHKILPMKKKILLFFAFILIFSTEIFAQYPEGHQSITYQDPARSNRNVTTEVYYPATSAGESTPFASGQFPLIVFGHGFVMGYDAYAYFKTAMVPLGYIVVFATTETSMSPSHTDFGLDLAFLLNKIKSEAATNSSSPFYGKLASTSAIMGHSMGGGSSFLACENNTVPTCMVTFAAANTTPPSITAAQSVTIPALVMSGEVDCVAPPAEHQIPMYDSLASACKVYISINDGGHCYFGDYNFLCTTGESSCMPVVPLARADQQDATLDFVKLYLDYYLKGNASAWTTFNDSLAASPRIIYLKSCPTTVIEENATNSFSLWPNPAENILYYSSLNADLKTIIIFDITGKRMHLETASVSGTIDISLLPAGIYTAEVISDHFTLHKKFIKQ